MTDDPPPASAAWQDVDCHLMQDMGGVCVYAYNAKEVNEARAADAQQIAALREELIARLNEGTRLVDEERRRWYAAIGGDHEGLAPEVVGQQIAALRAENEQLHSASKQAAVALVDWVWRAKESEAQLTALQTDRQSFVDLFQPGGRFYGVLSPGSHIPIEGLRWLIDRLTALQAEQAQWQQNEDIMLSRLSATLTDGNAGTWDEICDAAETALAALTAQQQAP